MRAPGVSVVRPDRRGAGHVALVGQGLPHPIGAKGIGECAAVGGPAAFVNAVMDALSDTGVRNIDMPLLPDRVYEALTTGRDVSGAPPVRSDDDG